jgi:hypothetical protein
MTIIRIGSDTSKHLSQIHGVDENERCCGDRHGSPPWSKFRNYVILSDNHRTRRGIMRLGVFYFPTDYGINIAELARALE